MLCGGSYGRVKNDYIKGEKRSLLILTAVLGVIFFGAVPAAVKPSPIFPEFVFAFGPVNPVVVPADRGFDGIDGVSRDDEKQQIAHQKDK